jgi:3-deoxy-D-manno-octulosonate 8-phosphate phosphatase KdsC-like HAD superfamily phosphatase
MIYTKKKNEVNQNFTISDGAGLTELDTSDIELLVEEACPSNKRL